MKRIKRTLLICVALLTTGAFAGQYTSNPSSAQPSQAPQTQSAPQSATGSAQPGQPQSAQPGAQTQAGRPSIDDQVKMLTQELNLTADQQTKMKNVLENQHQQAMTIINDSALAREDKIQKIRSLRETTIAQARGMLNDEQKKKLDSMLQESDRIHQQQNPGAATPGSSGSNSPSSTAPAGTPPQKPPR